MRILALYVAAVALQPSFCLAQTNATAKPPAATAWTAKLETPHLVFVREYIRELAAIENIRAAGEEENNQDKADDKLPFSGLIHTSTRFQLELGSQVRMLKGMRLNPPFETLIPSITDWYERKVALWKRMGEIGGEFIGGPKPGVDYSKLAAEMPQIRAALEYIDQSLFGDVAPLVFATLVDTKADSKGHASHLIITKEEKADLISKLNVSFGDKLDQKNPNYTVGAASVLRDYLNKDYKCSDEPWE